MLFVRREAHRLRDGRIETTSHSTKIRIAHVISTRRGVAGAERVLGSLVDGGHARGYEQLVLHPFVTDWPPGLEPLFSSSLYRPFSVSRLGVVPVHRWLQAEIDRFSPDIVHALLPRAAIMVASLRRRSPAKWLLTHAHGEGIRQLRFGRALEQVDRWAGRRFDHVVALSEAGRRYLETHHGYPPSKVVVISPGWHGQPLKPRRDGLPPTVVCVAKLRAEKGHDVLLEAFSLVREEVPTTRLVLVGDGDLRGAREAQAARLGLAGSVEFVGEVAQVWPYLATAHVFAIASRSEAFGIAIAEAMAAGLPVVAPAVGGIVDLISPGVSGELFPPGDHRTMARHLVRLLTSPAACAQMGAAGRRAAEQMTMENAVRRYVRVYEHLVASSAS